MSIIKVAEEVSKIEYKTKKEMASEYEQIYRKYLIKN